MSEYWLKLHILLVMNQQRLIFAQIVDEIDRKIFQRCVDKYEGNARVRTFTCRNQFLCMAFGQLTRRESLTDIVTCLQAHNNKLYMMGIHGEISKSTLADANEKRDWRIYADLAQRLIKKARPLYQDEDFGVDLKDTVYALDATTIDLCLNLFPWAKFRKRKGAVKLHTLIELRGSIPTFIDITEGKVHDVNVLDTLEIEPGAWYVMDRGYVDFARLYSMDQALGFFVIRAKSNYRYKRISSSAVDKSSGVRSEQTIKMASKKASKDYPDKLRRIRYYDKETKKYFVYLTNNFTVAALIICQLYKARWKIELFFKWIKQHLRIKRFFGTSSNALKTQVWIAICVYVILAIIKMEFKLEQSIYSISQILSLSSFEKVSLYELLTEFENRKEPIDSHNQLMLNGV